MSAALERFKVAIEEHERRSPPEKRDLVRLKQYHADRGVIYLLLGKYSEAIAEFKQTGSLETMPNLTTLIQVQRGAYDQAESAAQKIARRDSPDGVALYFAAQLGAYMAAVVRNDRSLAAARREELAEKYGKQAVQWLQGAYDRKYFSAPSTRYLLTDDFDLEPLRSRADFQALLARSNAMLSSAK